MLYFVTVAFPAYLHLYFISICLCIHEPFSDTDPVPIRSIHEKKKRCEFGREGVAVAISLKKRAI